ncbi:hypothetical protein OJAV_G00109260 [Oryzias javanicus]|uniref:Uncharacterized protein n=1 Tax=Oryzias javanicus TaxID=123683 RepID=A0A3S2UAI0_ORYJA|nr:hypothetical protein OJAV_G00109260 [Oryzias javanicus]
MFTSTIRKGGGGGGRGGVGGERKNITEECQRRDTGRAQGPAASAEERKAARKRESQSRSVMLHHQDLNSSFGDADDSSSPPLQNRNKDKDRNFNFLPEKGDSCLPGDENRNQMRPRNLALGRDPPSSSSSPSSGFQLNAGLKSPRSRLPCWRTLEPLPEIESGDDGYGRVPPDGAEEERMEEEEERVMMMRMMNPSGKKKEVIKGGGRPEEDEELDDEWGDSDSESGGCRSGGSQSSLNMESGGEAPPFGGWDRIGVGEPKIGQTDKASNLEGALCLPGDQSSDSDGELPELMDTVWTLRDRERFKVQEMEKHQAQLTMYRRLALIRWVRTLQSRVQEQQNRLQSSFDVILTHRKELLRMGAAAAVASPAPAAAVGQS